MEGGSGGSIEVEGVPVSSGAGHDSETFLPMYCRASCWLGGKNTHTGPVVSKG